MTGDFANKDAKKQAGPDGWESWRMVMACFTTTFLVGGSTRSAAVLYIAVMETFGVGRGEAAWPISLISGFLNCSGMLSGPLSAILGLRLTCVIGGCVSFVALSLCYFATGITYLTLCFGVLNGLGIGLMYNLNPVILMHYFQKYKGLALGINYCGSTVAAMVFPKFMEFLYRRFGMNELFLIYAAIILNTPVISYLMRKPSWTRKQMRAPDISREFIRRFSSVRESRSQSMRSRSTTIAKESRSRSGTLRSRSGTLRSRIDDTAEGGSSRSRSTSISVAGMALGNGDVDLVLATDIGMGALPMVLLEEDDDTTLEQKNSHLDDVSVRDNVLMPTIEELPHSSPIPNVSVVVEEKQVEDAQDLHDPEARLSLREIFCNPMFYLLIVSYLIFSTFTDILLTVIVDLFCDKGVDQTTAIATIPLISVFDMAGRITLPFIADKGIVDRKMVFAINFFCLGILAMIIPSVSGYTTLTGLFLLVGWFYGSTVVMCTVIVSDLIGTHNLAVANGLICSSSGYIAFGRPAFIGFFRDTIGSYNPMLYFWGICCLTMALVWTVVLAILRRYNKNE